MKRIATGLCVTAATVFAVSLAAQTSTTSSQRSSSTTDKAHEVTVTGCLARDASGGFTLNNARMENGKSSTTTTAGTAGSTTTTNPRSSASSEMSNSPAMNWMLTGGSDLDKHVGHKIEVTGKTSYDAMNHTSTSSAAGAGTTAATTAGTSGTREGNAHGAEPRLDVQSVKMISSSCS